MQDVTCVMCGAELVQLWRRVPSAVNWEEVTNFQARLYISVCAGAGADLFMKRQVKYVTSNGCGLKCQGQLQVTNSDWIGEVFQLQYPYVKSISCVCVRRYNATDSWFSLYSKQLNTYVMGQNRQRVAAYWATFGPFLRKIEIDCSRERQTDSHRLLGNLKHVLIHLLTRSMQHSPSW